MHPVAYNPSAQRYYVAKGAEDGTGGRFVRTAWGAFWHAWQQACVVHQAQQVEAHRKAREEHGKVTHGAEGGGPIRTQPTAVEIDHKHQVTAWGWRT